MKKHTLEVTNERLLTAYERYFDQFEPHERLYIEVISARLMLIADRAMTPKAFRS